MFETLTGIPFRFRGRSLRDGLDCLGLVLAALRQLGRSPTDPWYHVREQYQNGMDVENYEPPSDWREIPVCEAVTGDVLACGVDGVEGHVVILAEPGWCLTTSVESCSHKDQVRNVDAVRAWRVAA